MPRTDCKDHGRSAGQHVCIHVDAAIAEKRKLSFSTAKHGLLPGTWLTNAPTSSRGLSPIAIWSSSWSASQLSALAARRNGRYEPEHEQARQGLFVAPGLRHCRRIVGSSVRWDRQGPRLVRFNKRSRPRPELCSRQSYSRNDTTFAFDVPGRLSASSLRHRRMLKGQ